MESTFDLTQGTPYSQRKFPAYSVSKKLKWVAEDASWINGQFSETLDNQFYHEKANPEEYLNIRPVFRLIDLEKKQTTYRAMADFSYAKDIEKIDYLVSVDEENAGSHTYAAVFQPVNQTWQADISISDYKRAGRYQLHIAVTHSDGSFEEIEFGEFVVARPRIQTTLDTSRTDKGQFDVLIEVDSPSDVEKLEVPVWTKDDKSDTKKYQAVRQDAANYKVRVDYEDFKFQNGAYKTEAFFTGQNGLTAHSLGDSAEINLTSPKRLRVLQDSTLYKNRQLNQGANQLQRNSMVRIVGVVYNDEQKIFKTNKGYISAENLAYSEKIDDVRYVVHRGNSKVAPENSIPAFEQANTWGVETDVQLTSDKHWVVLHDDYVDRMTNGSGAVSQMTLAQIRSLRIDSGTNVGSYSPNHLIVPTLEEFLMIMQNKQAIPLIDIKAQNVTADDFDRLTNLIGQYGFADSGTVISFNYLQLQEVKRRLPNIRVQLLSEELDEQIIADVHRLGSNAGLDVRYENIQSKVDLVAAAQSQGLQVNAWTVPKREWGKAEALGVDFITAKTSPKSF
ncbi:hypothetical protein NRIC_36080 [Enterococcus florum]|uniref:GP-PDE domain-containing protein n=1 Tax=Enterococcus florum TaxID=2480627 RepID=A0A4P5PBZ8_9ENTE|nr:glycerophosphodiester phosphodiesterase family protein [Enterococcus florum]GCF95717.1 hypothetical protein NRIC_36080 [Enterococcus florum]